MKLIVATVAVCLAIVVSGSLITDDDRRDDKRDDKRVADKEILKKQKFFFEVLRNIHMPLKYDEYLPYTKTIVEDKTKYDDYDVVKDFLDMYKKDLFLDKGEVFTVYNKYMLKQTYKLFKFLYNARDWDTYYKNVIWAREHINEGMFIYAVTLTVLHCKDLRGIVLPPIHEIYPYYFFNNDLIKSVFDRKMFDPKFGFYGDGKYNVVYSNFTMTYPLEDKDKDKEKDKDRHFHDYRDLDYYHEDVGLNSFYYYFKLDYPFFLDNDKFDFKKERRGELYLYIHHQLLARYNLERFSHDKRRIMGLTWRFPLKDGYFSLLSYAKGIPFKSRDDNYMIRDVDYYKVDWIKDWEMRMRKVIDDGYYLKDDGTKIDLRRWDSIDFLGKMLNCMDVDKDDKKDDRRVDNKCKFGFIEMLSRTVLSGMDFMTKKTWPTVLMHFETSLRDPMFYKLWDRLLDVYRLFKSYLPYYKFEELNFKGVVIKDVVVDKLMTYFEYFDSDVSNVVPMTEVRKYFDFTVKGRTKRLNHKTFTYKLDVLSDTTDKGVLRVFIGPKFDKLIDLDRYKDDFVEIDHHVVDLVAGKNTIVRNSRDFFWSVKDRTTYVELYKKIMLAFDGSEEFLLDMSEAHCGFPDRLILPKGKIDGIRRQLYFIITRYTGDDSARDTDFDKRFVCDGRRYKDKLPMGFPFDREIKHTYWYTKNMLFKDVLIYHKDDVNRTY
ncbi:hexamerin-1.1-like [Topomyia yanbarensis]|uniref:hexamerin-1.1-like n=1 Tax=Topomyia yanbarensis TaxID=2498891 RepID=UPI00273B2901|nr:hexamerin-1.1-like [Topomyia yanbarensis]